MTPVERARIRIQTMWLNAACATCVDHCVFFAFGAAGLKVALEIRKDGLQPRNVMVVEGDVLVKTRRDTGFRVLGCSAVACKSISNVNSNMVRPRGMSLPMSLAEFC